MGAVDMADDMSFKASDVRVSARAHEQVRDVVVGSGTSFFWAMRLLPKDRRQAIFAVYAFCRRVDDIADEPGSLAQKRIDLDLWRAHIEALYAHDAPLNVAAADIPIIQVLSDAIAQFDLKKTDFLAVIDGMDMDANGPIIAPDRQTLYLYCDRVASAVGRLCVPIFGQADDKGRRVADYLGLALQLTNIIRDVPDDAQIGRLYLPLESLENHGLNGLSPMEIAAHPDMPKVCADLGARAERAFTDAQNAIAECDPQAMRAPILMMKVYALYYERLKAADWDPHHLIQDRRWAKMGFKARRLWTVIRYGLF